MRQSLTKPTAWIASEAHEAPIAEADRYALDETGGLVIGYRHSQDQVVITSIIGPGPAARHQRAGFHPDSEWQAAELADLYERSKRRIRYLGDWHSHPGGSTGLSRLDRRTLGVIAQEPAAQCPHPIMIILAGGNPWLLNVFQQSHRRTPRRQHERLEVLPYVQDPTTS